MYTTFFILPPRNTSDHSLRCSFNRIQTVYVCMYVYMYVCVCLFINDHFKTRILWSPLYVSCVSSFLFIRSSFISLLFRFLSRNAQWQSVEIDVFYLELVLLFFVLRRILELARQCWLTRAAGRLPIDVEESTMKRAIITYFFVSLNNNHLTILKILINLKMFLLKHPSNFSLKSTKRD